MSPALSRLEQQALRALRGRSAVLIDRRWRVRGIGAPVLNAFALATLLGERLVALHAHGEARRVVLTVEGARLADRLIERSLPAWLARA